MLKRINGIVHVFGMLKLPLEPGPHAQLTLQVEHDYPELPEIGTAMVDVVLDLDPDLAEELFGAVLDAAEVELKRGRNAPDQHTVERPAAIVDRAKFDAKEE